MVSSAFIPSSCLTITTPARSRTRTHCDTTFGRPVISRSQRSSIAYNKLYPDPLPPQYDDSEDSEESIAESSASYLERLNGATANRLKKQSAFTSQGSNSSDFEGDISSLSRDSVLRSALLRDQRQSSTDADQKYQSSPQMSTAAEGSSSDHAYKPASRALWRIGWLTWWAQLILTIVSAVIVGFALTFPSVDVGTSASSIGFVLIGIAIIVAFVSLFCTFGYTRLSLWLQSASASDASSKAPSKISYRLRVGISVALLGLAFATLGLQAIVGTLLARLLTTGIGSTNIRSLDSNAGGVATPLVQPVDVLVVQASANIILALLTVVLTSLWFRRRAEVWEQNAGTSM